MDSQQLVWRGNTLLDAATAAAGAQSRGGDSGVGDSGDAGAQLAHVLSDVIYIGDEESLLIERLTRTVRFRCRGTTSGGEVFTLTQPGFTVSTLVGDCAGRSYELRRVSPWRKGRVITRGDVEVAHIETGVNELHVSLVPLPEGEGLPLIDVVFLTWCCVLVDMPQREMRI